MSAVNAKKRKLEIENDLKKDPPDPRYTFVAPPNKMKSNVWKNFQLVKFEDILENFARCIVCKEILAYSAKSGTGSLLRHTCSRQGAASAGESSKSSSTQPTLTKFSIKKLPEKVKHEIQKQQIGFITKDLRPLNITEGDGFKKFGQALINIGAQYGHQNIEDILVSRRTLTRTVIPAEYDRVKNQLEDILSHNQVAFTTDMWTDEYTQRSFLTLTVHYINEDFNLKTNILGTREFTLDRKTAVNIRDFVIEILMEFKIVDKIKSGVIVTDNGANVVAAFRNYKRLSCACHNLNLVMDDVLEKQKIPELEVLIDASKRLVSFFKRSELNSKLTKALKQHVKTRWNSLFVMLSSILDVYQEIQQLLIDGNELYKIAAINYNLLEHLVGFLRPFKDCSEKLSSDVAPTIHVYSLWFEKLIKHCAENPEDSMVITELKTCTLTSLKNRFQPSTVHNVALFLNPPYKTLKFMSEEQRVHIRETIKVMLDQLLKEKQTTTENSANSRRIELENEQPSGSGSAPSTSINSGKNDPFDEFKDKYDEDGTDADLDKIETELKIYLKKNVSQCDVLEFWRDALDLPLLRNLSRQILNIPASSATSERVFSTSGRILEERRTRLLSENLDQILFLNKNLNY